MAGDAVTLTAFVGGPGRSTPQGTVKFTAGSLDIGSAPTFGLEATVTTSSPTPGTYNVVASFTGQVGSTSSQSAPQTLTVTQIRTMLGLTASPATAVSGTAVTMTAMVSYPATSLLPSGTMRILDTTGGGSRRLRRWRWRGWLGELHDEHAAVERGYC